MVSTSNPAAAAHAPDDTEAHMPSTAAPVFVLHAMHEPASPPPHASLQQTLWDARRALLAFPGARRPRLAKGHASAGS
jgi:hypothetical protein